VPRMDDANRTVTDCVPVPGRDLQYLFASGRVPIEQVHSPGDRSRGAAHAELHAGAARNQKLDVRP
jgi:hypothetical protein